MNNQVDGRASGLGALVCFGILFGIIAYAKADFEDFSKRERAKYEAAETAQKAAKEKQEKANWDMAEKIANKINEAERKKFCNELQKDRSCETKTGDIAKGCVLTTDDSGRCVILKRFR